MKPAPFAYAKAKSLDHAIELLASPTARRGYWPAAKSDRHAQHATVGAKAFDRPEHGVEDRLAGIALKSGMIEIGALTRHVEAERSEEIAEHAP